MRMRSLKISVLFLFAAALVLPFTFTSSVEGQSATEALTTQMDARQPDTDLFNNLGPLGAAGRRRGALRDRTIGRRSAFGDAAGDAGRGPERSGGS